MKTLWKGGGGVCKRQDVVGVNVHLCCAGVACVFGCAPLLHIHWETDPICFVLMMAQPFFALLETPLEVPLETPLETHACVQRHPQSHAPSHHHPHFCFRYPQKQTAPAPKAKKRRKKSKTGQAMTRWDRMEGYFVPIMYCREHNSGLLTYNFPASHSPFVLI